MPLPPTIVWWWANIKTEDHGSKDPVRRRYSIRCTCKLAFFSYVPVEFSTNRVEFALPVLNPFAVWFHRIQFSNSALISAPNLPASGRWRGHRVCLYSLACSPQVQCHPRGQGERTWRMTPHRTSTRLPVSGTGARGHIEPCGHGTRQCEPGRTKLCNRASASLIRQLCKSPRRRGR